MTQSCSTKSGLIALDPLFGNALNLKITETKKNTRYTVVARPSFRAGAREGLETRPRAQVSRHCASRALPHSTADVVCMLGITSTRYSTPAFNDQSNLRNRTFAMAVDMSKLRQNAFWNKKFDHCIRAHDTNKSGDISRADFLRIRERYKSLKTSNPQHMERLSKYQAAILDRVGLQDESVKLSYAELKENFIQSLSKVEDYDEFFGATFQNQDINGDGVISFEEWKAHYYCMGIDTAHARASFDAMDKNGDGKISKEEFVNFHHEFYFTVENKLGSDILYGPYE